MRGGDGEKKRTRMKNKGVRRRRRDSWAEREEGRWR